MGRKRKEKAEPNNPYIKLLPSAGVETGKGGRPPKTLTEAGWRQVTTLSQFMATDEEIATALSGDSFEDWDTITVDTLTNALNKERFSEAKAKGKNKGKISLRSWQWASAKNGNVTMQIYLGKNYLGQSDKAEIEVPDTQININISAATEDDVDNDD